MRIYPFILAVLLVVTGCKTTKNSIKETTNTQNTVANDVKQTSLTTDKTVVDENKTDKTTLADSVVVNIVDVVWSKPDSSGKQYPEKTTYKKETRTSKKKADVVTDKQTKTDVNSKVENIDKSKTNNNTATNKKQTEASVVKTPSWLYVSAIILSLGLLVLVYFILRRFRIIQ